MPELDDLAPTTDTSVGSGDELDHTVRAELAASFLVLILTVAILFFVSAAVTGPEDDRAEPLDPDALRMAPSVMGTAWALPGAYRTA
jgi:hypothetical protein